MTDSLYPRVEAPSAPADDLSAASAAASGSEVSSSSSSELVVFNRHVPLRVLQICGVEVVRAGAGTDPWSSDARISFTVPHDVALRNLSAQMVDDVLPDVTARGYTMQVGYVAAGSPMVAPPASNTRPQQVFTIVAPLTRGPPTYRYQVPLLDHVRFNDEALPLIHLTVKVPGVTTSGSDCMWRLRFVIERQTGQVHLISFGTAPIDMPRVKEATANFGVWCGKVAASIKKAFASKKPEGATTAAGTAEPNSGTVAAAADAAETGSASPVIVATEDSTEVVPNAPAAAPVGTQAVPQQPASAPYTGAEGKLEG